MSKMPVGGLIMVVMLASVAGANGKRLGVTEGTLAPCPDSPNCISTQSEHPRHFMKPLPFLQTHEASRQKILNILKAIERATIVTATESYIHAEFRTVLWRFVDDVEFHLDEIARVVHFRSASRVGYYDFGANRRRMKTISDQYLTGGEK